MDLYEQKELILRDFLEEKLKDEDKKKIIIVFTKNEFSTLSINLINDKDIDLLKKIMKEKGLSILYIDHEKIVFTYQEMNLELDTIEEELIYIQKNEDLLLIDYYVDHPMYELNEIIDSNVFYSKEYMNAKVVPRDFLTGERKREDFEFIIDENIVNIDKIEYNIHCVLTTEEVPSYLLVEFFPKKITNIHLFNIYASYRFFYDRLKKNKENIMICIVSRDKGSNQFSIWKIQFEDPMKIESSRILSSFQYSFIEKE